VDYSHALLDKMWILCAFSPILNEFQQKCSVLSREKRKQERDFDKQQAAAFAKLETIKEVQGALINGATELPWYLPYQETMEEMLRDHICKVCGRTVEDNSEAYHFMVHKIEEYKAHVEAKLKREQEKQSLE
jgi:DNA sulfur modification protein DndD